MRLLGDNSRPAAPFRPKRGTGWKTLTLLLLPFAVGAAQPASMVIKGPAFDDAFRSYYDALSAHTPEDLMVELSETIEDVLISGSHMSVSSLDYKVRQIESVLLARLRGELCTPSSPSPSELGPLKLAAVKSATAAGEQASVPFNPEELGMITGVAVRLVQGIPRTQLCSGG